jgi:imidazolonepropionase-like amidohydrolase
MGTPMSGADSIRSCYRENFSRGADCAKIFVSGGSHSVTGLYVSFYSREEIEAAVEEAHRFGVKIAGHCHGGIGTTWFIEAGGDSVEHGQVLTEEQMDLMKERDTYLDITLPGGLDPAVIDRSLEWLERDEKMRARIEERARQRADGTMPVPREVYRKAMEKGVKFTTNQDGHFGHMPWNVISLVEMYDLSPMNAIITNTRNAAECCGILDNVGTLEPGKYADLISIKGDPLENIRNIRDKGMIMVGGRIYDPDTRYWKGLDPVEVIMSK